MWVCSSFFTYIERSSRPPKGTIKKKITTSDGIATSYIPVSVSLLRSWQEILTNIKSLAEQYSYLHIPKRFKNPHYTKNTQRRVKNLKTILGQEREYEKADRERCHQARAEAEAQGQFRMHVDREGARSRTREDEEETATCVWYSPGQVLNNGSFSGCRYLDRSTTVCPSSEPVLWHYWAWGDRRHF